MEEMGNAGGSMSKRIRGMIICTARMNYIEWIPRVKEINNNTKKSFIYFNNHYKAKAAKSALIFLDLLKSNNIATSQN